MIEKVFSMLKGSNQRPKNNATFKFSLAQNFEDIERIYKMSFSQPTVNGMLQILSFFKSNNYMELFKTVPAYFMAF